MPKVAVSPPPPLQETDDLIAAPQEVYDLAAQVMFKHPELKFLIGYQIKYLLRKKTKTKTGRRVLGSAKVTAKADKLLHNWDAVVTLDRTFWDGNPDLREPLLVHELCHFGRNDTSGDLEIVGHDIEEFYYVYKHYGDWLGELTKVNQMQLDFKFGAIP